MRVSVATPLDELTEKQWQSQVVALARMLAWTHVYHTFNSRRSQSGFPDLFMVRDRAIALELKTEKGQLSPAQREWLTALRQAGVEAYIARPRDLAPLADVLTARHRIVGALEVNTRAELVPP